MPTWRPGGSPYYSPVQPKLRAEASPGKSEKMGISRNLNRRLIRQTVAAAAFTPGFFVFGSVAFTLICGY
jgi:hypothetical protein